MTQNPALAELSAEQTAIIELQKEVNRLRLQMDAVEPLLSAVINHAVFFGTIYRSDRQDIARLMEALSAASRT